MSNIQFFFEEIESVTLDLNKINAWLGYVCEQESKRIEDLNYILCSDDYLLKINIEYLQHDYYTDVITFDNSEESDQIEGDIFVSIERIKDNAKDLNVSFEQELQRVIVHGLLHLIGFNDKTDEQKQVMREKENAYLSLPEFQI